jgi:hypothetical protein
MSVCKYQTLLAQNNIQYLQLVELKGLSYSVGTSNTLAALVNCLVCRIRSSTMLRALKSEINCFLQAPPPPPS